MTELTAIIRKDDIWFVADCPELGTVSQGRTEEEAFANLQDATKLFMEEVEENDRQTDISSIISRKFSVA